MKIKFVWIRSFLILCLVTPSLENAGMSLSSYLFSLSHRQAAVERGFSVNKELLVGNFQQLSLVSQRIVNDYVTDFGKSIIKVPLTSALLKSSQLAHSRYSTVLEMNKNEAHAQEKNRKRKLKTEEFAELKEKKRALEAVRN